MLIEQSITIGNLIVIIIVIIGAVASTIINTFTISAKTAKFVAVTEMKFQAGEKKFVEHDKDIDRLQTRCDICPQKIRVENLEKEKNEMKAEQLTLRATLPMELTAIKEDIGLIKNNITEILKMVTNIGIKS